MNNMLSWNWPNWITVVLMVAVAYVALTTGAQLVRGRLGAKGGPVTGSGAGPSQAQDNFAGIFGGSEFAVAGG